MKYLKEFETASAYETAKSSLELPNVSLISETNAVAYKPVDPYAGHDYVDLGLPSGIKWATMNIGASSETDYGNYYQYGKGAEQYAATSGQSDYSGTENPLAASADTAVQVWGGQWHMPTKVQFEELTANTTYEWTTIDGVNGGKFTAQNGNYIFLPASGYLYDGNKKFVGYNGSYWSSTRSTSVSFLKFSDGSKYVFDSTPDAGYTIRAVAD